MWTATEGSRAAEAVLASAAIRLLALLGWPVAHSLSPQLHAAAIADAGLDLAYLAFGVPPESLEAAVAGLGALGAVGANVTVPHKAAVLALADEVGSEAAAVGAANTLTWRDGRLVADNTDLPGLLSVLAGLGIQTGDGVLLCGAGGAARAAAGALGRAGTRVEVVGRRSEAVADVRQVLVAAGGSAEPVVRPRLLVNATPLGLHGEDPPARLLEIGPGQIALDLVYGREPTPFLRAAAAAGATAADGLGLLVAQAAFSFAIWTGAAPPHRVMQEAARVSTGRTGTWVGSPVARGDATLR